MENRNWMFSLLALLLYVSSASAQLPKDAPPTTFSQVERDMGNMVEGVIVSVAEAMPEDKYSFAPTAGEFKGVRNFGQQLKHLASSNYEMASAILGEKPPVDIGGENGPDSVQGKAEIINYVKNSYTYLGKALLSIDEKNATDQVQSSIQPGKVSRLWLGSLSFLHAGDHYGQLVEYLRMNGIVPPASR